LAQIAPQAVEDDQEATRIVEMAARLDAETVQLYYQIAVNGRRDLPFAPDEISGFSMTLLRMLAFTPASSTSRTDVAVKRAATNSHPSPSGRGAGGEGAQPTIKPRSSPLPAGEELGVRENAKTASAHSSASPHSKAEEPSPFPLIGEDTGEWEDVSSTDWPAIVASLKLGGMARMLADQCELKSHDSNTMLLGLAEVHKHLLDKTYQDKLVAALKQKFGEKLKVQIELGAASGQSPVEVRARAKAEKQAEAVAAIESDPFIRDLVDQFDARIDPSTIQPLGEQQ